MQLFALLAICILASDVYSKTTTGDVSTSEISAVKESSGNYGEKTGAASNTQIKRDISLSYAATNIDSKEGTRVKTITVIKNLNNKHERLKIDPKLHKNEEWASAFRDNFDSYGHLPDVPDIDDLFEFVNKKSPKDDKNTETTLASGSMPKEMSKPEDGAEKKEKKQPMKPVEEKAEKDDDDMESGEDVDAETDTKKAEATTKKSKAGAKLNIESSAETVEKIKGDAEVIPLTKNRHRAGQGHGALGHSSKTGGGARGSSSSSSASGRKSQSLGKDKERFVESMFNVNYSTPQHSVHQYFENYVQEIPKGYEYPKPCQHAPPNSVQVTTPSGRSYDVPYNRSGYGSLNPYLAPSLTRKTQISTTTQQPNGYNYQNPNFNNNNPYPGTYSVNSILPPLQSQPGGIGGGQRNLNIYPPLGDGNNGNIPIPSSTLQPAAYDGVGNTNSGAPNQQGFQTTQNPYLAPNLRNGLNGLSRGVHVISNFMYNKQLPNGYRANNNNNAFGGGNGGFQRPSSIYRSRGIKY